jgi:hypothetical protein
MGSNQFDIEIKKSVNPTLIPLSDDNLTDRYPTFNSRASIEPILKSSIYKQDFKKIIKNSDSKKRAISNKRNLPS